jgi:deazaflavin-dependent oxidoreductase (nitroreductase family)
MSVDYEPSAMDWVREQVEKIIDTGTTDGVTVADRPIVLLTYRGAKTGKVRKTPVMRVENDGSYAAIASMGGAPTNPAWYQALAKDPVIELQDGTEVGTYRAREVSGEEKSDWWERGVAAYPPYADYQGKTDRNIPVFVLEPVSG